MSTRDTLSMSYHPPNYMQFQAYSDIMDVDRILMMSGTTDPNIRATDILCHYTAARLGGKSHDDAVYETMVLFSYELGEQVSPSKLHDMMPTFARQIRKQLQANNEYYPGTEFRWVNRSAEHSGILTLKYNKEY